MAPPPEPRIRAQINNRQRVELKGDVVSMARPAFDRGAAAPDLQLKDMLLLLRRSPEQEAALQQLLEEQQEKSSPEYHHWLTPAEFGARFGPAPADIAKITNWLETEGFTVNQVAPGGGVIEFSGTELQLEAAFRTSIHRYEVRGAMHLANSTDPSIPAALAPVVAGVVSLNDFRARPMGRIVGEGTSPMAAQGRSTPGITFTGADGEIEHALVPGDLRKIYDAAPIVAGSNGFEQRIAVVERALPGGTDLQDFQDLFREPNTAGGAGSPEYVGSGSISTNPGDVAEATLDLEWATAFAPDASIDPVVSGGSVTTDGVDLAALAVVDEDLAPVVSTSFGECEADMGATEEAFWSQLWEQAAAEGITSLVSAGDQGAAGCDDGTGLASGGLAVNGIASTPYDTAVGGTEFDDMGSPQGYWAPEIAPDYSSALGYIPEEGWSESFPATSTSPASWAAGGGGASATYAKPPWQTGFGSGSMRDVPDVSLAAASHDGYVICLDESCKPNANGEFSFYVVGGTSASAPAMAGVVILLIQQQGGPLGLINPTLYRLAQTPSTNVYHDVTAGSNDAPCSAGSPGCVNGVLGFPAMPGYDLATGLGSVDVMQLLENWGHSSYAASATTFTLNPPDTWTHGEAVPLSVQVSGAGSGSGPSPTGSVVLMAQATGSYNPSQTYVPVQAFALGANGAVQTESSLLPGGTYSVLVRYGGDANYAPSESSPQTVTVGKEASQTTLGVYVSGSDGQLSPATSLTYGDPVTIETRVSAASGHGIPEGSVTLQGTDGSVTLDGSGEASPTGLILLHAGQLSVVAQYQGDNSFEPSSSAPVDLNLAQAPTQIQLTTSHDSMGDVDIEAVLTTKARYGMPLTGSVDFSVGGKLMTPAGISQGSTNGYVSGYTYFAPTDITGTTYTVTAQYSGDTNYLPSNKASLTTPTPANLQITPAAVNFGSVVIGSSSAPQAVTFRNAGGTPASTEPWGFVPTDFSLSGCPASLAPGASCTAEVTFSPQAVGDRSTQVLYVGFATLQLNGVGTGFVLTSNSGQGSVAAGQSASFSVALSPSGGFQGTVTLSCANLPPLASCTVFPATVTLDGTHGANIAVKVSTTGPGTTSTSGVWMWLLCFGGGGGLGFVVWVWGTRRRARGLVLVGIGIVVAAAVACGGGGGGGGGGIGSSQTKPVDSGPLQAPTASPSRLDFGNVVVGQVATQTLVVTNNGPVPAYFELSFEHVDTLSESDDCRSRTVGVQDSCSAQIIFNPSHAGAVSDTLDIQAHDADNAASVSVPVTGTGILTSTPSGLYFINLVATSGTATAQTELGLSVH